MTTTREAALEAALKLARNRLQACAIDHPTGSREMAERSEWADEATAALSTPATEPQGYVVKPLVFDWKPNPSQNPTAMQLRTDDYQAYVLIPFEKGFDPANGIGLWNAVANNKGLSGFATKEIAMENCEALIVNDAQNALNFARTAIEKWALAARPAPQPAAEHEYPDPLIAEDRYEDDQPAVDTRVVVKPLVWKPEDAPCTRFKAEALGGHMMIVELDPETHPGTYSVGVDLGGLCFKFVLAEYDDFLPKYTAPAKFEGIEAAKAAAQADYEARILSAIIGTATPAPSDKIAEAARVLDLDPVQVGEISNYYGGLWIKAADGVPYWSIEDYSGDTWEVCPMPVFAALRALAGKGE